MSFLESRNSLDDGDFENPPFAPQCFFWSIACALLASPLVAWFVDEQIAAACCENARHYGGALMLCLIFISIFVLFLSPLMMASSGVIYWRIGSTRPRRIAFVHVLLGGLVGAGLGYGGFAQWPPWLEEAAYPGIHGLIPGGLTGALAGFGWWWGLRRELLAIEAEGKN